MNANDYCIAMTTTNSKLDASQLARKLVASKLAACVQIQTIESHYVWAGEAQEDAEFLLSAKTRTDLFEALSNCITREHPYETPEIISVPIMQASQAYLAWLDQNTRR